MRHSSISASRPGARPSVSRRALTARIASALFVAALCAPGLVHAAGALMGRPLDADALGRAPAPAPSLADAARRPAAFFEQASAYLDDHLGLRALFTGAYAQIALEMSAPTSNVAPGADGWLFFMREDSLEGYQGRQPPRPGMLEGWRAASTALAARARQEGAALVLIAPPNKNRIYEEHMPAWAGAASPTRLLSLLRDDPTLQAAGLVDVEPALIAAKSAGRVYYQTDTHWTRRGAYAAYSEIMDALVARGEVQSTVRRARVADAPARTFSGDLARAVGAQSGLSETYTPLEIIDPRLHERTDIQDKDEPIIGTFVERAQPDDGRTLVIVGDSFADGLIPFFRESFSTVYFTHHRFGAFDADEVFAWKPDVVLVSVIERVVDRPLAPTGLGDADVTAPMEGDDN